MRSPDDLMTRSASIRWKSIRAAFATVFIVLPIAFWFAQGAEVRTERGVGGVSVSGGIYRNSWAVVIGINQYTKAPQLNYAVNDAKSVVAAVQKLGFASDKILLLLDQQATKQRIEQILYGTLRRTTPQDRVLVFFAGHGMTSALPRGGEEGFILPVDADPEDLPLTAIAMADVRQIARRIPAKHILFTMDACYSGFAISRDVPARLDPVYLDVVTKHPAVEIITAGRKDEPVVEEEGHGIFTRHMLSGLTGPADVDANGIITAQELANWLRERIIRDSENKQHPQYSRLDGEGQFIFLLPGRERPGAGLVSDEQKYREEMKRLAQEAERLKRERVLFEEERKLQTEKQRIELAKFEAERALFKAETERFALERARTQKAELLDEKRAVEEQAKTALAKLESERAQLEVQEQRIAEEKTRVPEPVLEAEHTQPAMELAALREPELIPKPTIAATPGRRAAPLPEVISQPTYHVGESWTVRFDDGRTAARTVRAIENDQYVFEWGLDLVRYYDRNLVLRRQITPEDGKDVFTELVRRETINFPLSVGKSWEFTIVSPQGRTTERRIVRFTAMANETIETPAGVFETVKIEEKSHVVRCVGCPILPGTISVRYWWFAPEAKFPIRLTTAVQPRRRDLQALETEQDYELVALDIRR